MQNTKTKIKDELKKISALPQKDKIAEIIYKNIQNEEKKEEKINLHFQSQLQNSKINIFEQNQELTRNLVKNETLHRQILSEQKAHQEQKTIFQLQAEHEAKRQKESQEKQKKSPRRNKKSLHKKVKNMRHPIRSMGKKALKKIPVVGGVLASGVGTVAFLEFLS